MPRFRTSKKQPITFVLFFLLANGTLASDPESESLTAFRSDLWNMEYRSEKEAEDKADSESNDETTESDPELKVERPQDEAAVLHKNSIDIKMSPPGQVDLSDLEQETPVAEWQVESGAQVRGARFHAIPSAWELSRASSFKNDKSGPTAKGPSATTFAVAIVACIVVTGALFSGRD